MKREHHLNHHFRFHGFAVAAAGRLEQPYSDLIEAQAATALAPIGGRATARSRNFHYRDMVKFDHAYSEITGSECDDGCEGSERSNSTHLRCTLEGLDILTMLTADRIVANLVSTDTGAPDGEPSVRLLGTRFENLRIAGIPVEVDLATQLLDNYDTYSALTKAYGSDKSLQELIDRPSAKTHKDAPEHLRRWLHFRESTSQIPEHRGRTVTSLVDKLTPERGGLGCWGHIIDVKGFGVIRLAEIEITRSTRLVNMVQIDLDCPYKGQLMFCMIADGGEGY
jgi:hypothetical protein